MAHNFVAKTYLACLAHCALSRNQIPRGYVLRGYAWHWWAGHAAAGISKDAASANRFALRLFNAVVFPILYNGPVGGNRDQYQRDVCTTARSDKLA